MARGRTSDRCAFRRTECAGDRTSSEAELSRQLARCRRVRHRLRKRLGRRSGDHDKFRRTAGRSFPGVSSSNVPAQPERARGRGTQRSNRHHQRGNHSSGRWRIRDPTPGSLLHARQRSGPRNAHLTANNDLLAILYLGSLLCQSLRCLESAQLFGVLGGPDLKSPACFVESSRRSNKDANDE